jgi:hypothetical protein
MTCCHSMNVDGIFIASLGIAFHVVAEFIEAGEEADEHNFLSLSLTKQISALDLISFDVSLLKWKLIRGFTSLQPSKR